MTAFRHILLFLVLCSPLVGRLDPNKGLSQFSHSNWDLTDGLTSNWVNGITQQKGAPYIWIATPTGLAKFDGVSFEILDSLSDPKLQGGIWDLAVGAEGELWIGSKFSGLLRMTQEGFSTVWGEDQQGPEEIRVLEIDSNNRVWMGSPEGLFYLENGKVYEVKPQGLDHAWIESLHEDANGKIWVGTQELGLFCYNKSLVKVQLKGFDDKQTIHCIQSDLQKNLWIGTKEGLFRSDGKEVTDHFTISDGLPSNAVRALYLDRSGCLWIGTESGIARYFKGSLIASKSTDPYSSHYVTGFYEDEEGSLWVGTKYNGFSQLWNAKFTAFGMKEGLKNEVINVVFEDLDGTLWIGTNQGCFILKDGVIEEAYADRLGETRIRDIYRDSRGCIWFCSYSGLFFSEQNDPGKLTLKEGLSSNLSRQVFEDSKGTIWIGTRAGLNRIEPDGGIISWSNPEIQNDFILHIIEDRKGDIWIATDGGGIARFSNNAFEWIDTDQGLNDSVVFKIYEDEQGFFWLATAKGISIVKDDEVYNIGPSQGLPSETIFQVIEDKYGMLWFTAHEGIFRISRSSLLDYLKNPEVLPEVTRFGPLDGLRTYQMTGVGESLVLADGNLCFSTAKGIALMDPTEIRINVFKPDVSLGKLVINGKPQEIPSDSNENELVFEPGIKKLEFHYTASSMIGADHIVFATQLIGFDDHLSETTSRSITYTNLDPGHYQFVAMASNTDGVQGEQRTVLRFRIKPHFNQTVWFHILIGLVSALLAYGLYSLRLLHLKRKGKLLELKVEKRTERITQQKEIIESKNMEIERNLRLQKAANTELKKLNDEKSYFLGVAAHDILNPLGNMMVLTKELMNQDVEPLSQAEQKDSLKLIYESSEGLLDLVNQLVESVALESGKIRLEKDMEDVAAISKSVVALNQNYAEAKNQHINLHCESHIPAFVDSLRIRSSMDNYVSNAIKYSPSGSSIEIVVEAFEKDEKRWLRFEVKDSGPGLTPNDFDKAFERFSKLSAKPTGNEISSGMGLSIVKQIIELHGGEVAVRNREEGGACFSFAIPLS